MVGYVLYHEVKIKQSGKMKRVQNAKLCVAEAALSVWCKKSNGKRIVTELMSV